jgi:hypothetical protein
MSAGSGVVPGSKTGAAVLTMQKQQKQHTQKMVQQKKECVKN